MHDPVKGCPVHKNEGCSHVDGYLCDYPNCDIMKAYMMKTMTTEDKKNLIKELLGVKNDEPTN